MGKGSRLGTGPCAKQQAEADPPPLDPAPPESQSCAGTRDAWSPLIRSSLVAESSRSSSGRRELRSAWGEEPLHPRKSSSRRLRLTQLVEERRERKS